MRRGNKKEKKVPSEPTTFDNYDENQNNRTIQIKGTIVDGRSTNSVVRTEILQAQRRCFQIQHSLYKTLVSKLRNLESQQAVESQVDIGSFLLPLEALLRINDIQLGLHSGLDVVKLDDEKHSEGDLLVDNPINKDEHVIESRSLMNSTQFAQSLVCFYLANPYCASKLIYACASDRISTCSPPKKSKQRTFGDEGYLPHGEGKLVNLNEDLIYTGRWKQGKRWGFGKAFIFCGTEVSASRKQYGMYEGHWWNNMRHGHGRLVFASSAVYDGEWQYDLMVGVGSMHYPNGSVLEGLWDEGQADGCGMFTWPNGVVEYREYNHGQVVRVLESTEETRKHSLLNEVMRDYSLLRLKHQMLEEEKKSLMSSVSRLEESLGFQASKTADLEKRISKQKQIKALRADFGRRLDVNKQKYETINKSHETKINELEDKINMVRVELEGKKSDLMCQICFDHDRDCIIMPCTHMLYCIQCIAKMKSSGQRRCPACRGPIDDEIKCIINQ